MVTALACQLEGTWVPRDRTGAGLGAVTMAVCLFLTCTFRGWGFKSCGVCELCSLGRAVPGHRFSHPCACIGLVPCRANQGDKDPGCHVFLLAHTSPWLGFCFWVFCLVLGPFPALFHSLLVRARTQVVVASLESSGLNWCQQPGCPIQRKGFCREVGRTTPYIEPTGGWSVPTPCLD